ncbi:MAG: MBL fold metallo-hydrolase [Acidimicrobiales bacterium]
MDLTVLGCSGSYPGPECPCSGYLVQEGEFNVLIDLGPGCLASLQRHIPLDSVSAVVLSHSHADHWSDLAGFHVASRYRYERSGIPVWGTAETYEIASLIPGNLEPTFEWNITGDGDQFAIGPLRFTLEQTDHYVETHAMRIESLHGGSMVYSADTGPEWSIEKLGSGVDLALVEATYGTDAEAEGMKHLSARAAGDMAKAAGAKRCVLTHFWPESDLSVHVRNGESAYGSPVAIASPHERYQL